MKGKEGQKHEICTGEGIRRSLLLVGQDDQDLGKTNSAQDPEQDSTSVVTNILIVKHLTEEESMRI